MTVDKLRFGGELDLPPEAEEMMANITELTGCAVVIPVEAKRRLKDTCESMDTTPQRVFACIMDGVLAAIETGVAGVFIQLRPLEEPGHGSEPDSDQVNGKSASERSSAVRISSSGRSGSKGHRKCPEMSQLGTFASVSAWLPQCEFRKFRVPAVKPV